jgi:hypothetical protein
VILKFCRAQLDIAARWLRTKQERDQALHRTLSWRHSMEDFRDSATDVSAINVASSTATSGPDWQTEDAYWQSAYPERPYARADRSYEFYRSAYRYGAERSARWSGREWAQAERDLREGWSAVDTESPSSWEEMKHAVRDAWDRVRGRSNDDRTHIR